MEKGEIEVYVPAEQPMHDTCKMVNMLATAGFKLEKLDPLPPKEVLVIRLIFKRKVEENESGS